MLPSCPAPKEPLDIAKALARTPPPHTRRRLLEEKNKHVTNDHAREITEDDRKVEFERIKRDLKSRGTKKF